MDDYDAAGLVKDVERNFSDSSASLKRLMSLRRFLLKDRNTNERGNRMEITVLRGRMLNSKLEFSGMRLRWKWR